MLVLTRLSTGLNIDLEFCRRQTIFVKRTNLQDNISLVPPSIKISSWSRVQSCSDFFRRFSYFFIFSLILLLAKLLYFSGIYQISIVLLFNNHQTFSFYF